MVDLRRVADLLVDAYPHVRQGWWPVDEDYHAAEGTDARFEVMVGAILTQNTSWTNVETALGNLKARRLLDPKRLARAPQATVRAAIRPVGYFNQKAGYLHAIAARVAYKWKGDLDAFLDRPVDELRQELLSLRGVGPETADSILVYAAEKPSFVIDAYTRRLMARLGGLPADGPYETVQRRWEGALGRQARRHAAVHGAIVEHAKARCTANLPRCPGCPLEYDCKKVGVDAKVYERTLGGD